MQMTFKSLQIGNYFTCPMHRRIYKKISDCFALDILHDEIILFNENEFVPYELD